MWGSGPGGGVKHVNLGGVVPLQSYKKSFYRYMYIWRDPEEGCIHKRSIWYLN